MYQDAIYKVVPTLILRENGGWLAVTPRGWPLAVGVEADSEDEAKQKFADAMTRWSGMGTDLQETRNFSADQPESSGDVEPRNG